MRTIRGALADARNRLRAGETPVLDAQVLLADMLDVDRAYLLAHGDEALPQSSERIYADWIERREAGEPIAYIIGRKAFYDCELRVTPDALIPRPETELLLEEGLRLMARIPECRVVDIGTGSGALALTFARRMPQSRVYASDISSKALRLARQNAATLGVEVEFAEGDLATPWIERGLKVDLLLANLPYIKTAELEALAVSRFEPRLALDGGVDGLALIRRLLNQAPGICRDGAWVLLEIGADQGAAMRELVSRHLNLEADILRDYAGLDRIARFRMTAKARA